jgi:hypothetical protein
LVKMKEEVSRSRVDESIIVYSLLQA